MTRALNAIFFVSGAAALIFETLWFRQAGLAVGNSVWASPSFCSFSPPPPWGPLREWLEARFPSEATPPS